MVGYGITEVDGIMRHDRTGNEKLGTQDGLIRVLEFLGIQWTHMMHDDLSGNRMTNDTKIETVVPGDHFVANTTPLRRGVKMLVHPPFMTECRETDFAHEAKILEPVFESRQLKQIRICSYHAGMVGPVWPW